MYSFSKLSVENGRTEEFIVSLLLTSCVYGDQSESILPGGQSFS